MQDEWRGTDCHDILTIGSGPSQSSGVRNGVLAKTEARQVRVGQQPSTCARTSDVARRGWDQFTI